MKVQAHLYISGRVQGVFFRVTILREARIRRLSGWVRNLPDGRVETVFEGDKDEIHKMIHFCKKGPSLADVKNVEVIWNKFTGHYNSFRIR